MTFWDFILRGICIVLVLVAAVSLFRVVWGVLRIERSIRNLKHEIMDPVEVEPPPATDPNQDEDSDNRSRILDIYKSTPEGRAKLLLSVRKVLSATFKEGLDCTSADKDMCLSILESVRKLEQEFPGIIEDFDFLHPGDVLLGALLDKARKLVDP